jgi:hypothetical protein
VSDESETERMPDPGSQASAPPEDGQRDHDALLDRIRVIEDQPLESRAAALGALHDELRSRLESSDQRA